jgi:hypothetical protein
MSQAREAGVRRGTVGSTSIADRSFPVADTRTARLSSLGHQAHDGDMARIATRHAAVQVGEFAVGVVVAYTAVALAWTLSSSIWPVVAAALLMVGVAVALELRYGAKATGLVAGILPTSMLVAGMLVALSLVAYRLN